MNKVTSPLLGLLLLSACGTKEEPPSAVEHLAPVISDQGRTVTFPDEGAISFFTTQTMSNQPLHADLQAPGKVAATVLPSGVGASRNVILFDDPELSSQYTQLVQHQINIEQIQQVNIKQKELELQRLKELQKYGATTGQEVLTAELELTIEQTNLANERTALIEHETQLRAGGFRAEMLQQAKPRTAYLICDIPENQIGNIQERHACSAVFIAFPKDTIHGEVDAVTDRVDPSTRMVKVRIIIDNSSGKLRTGMFAKVSFGITRNDILSVDQNALITIQGKHYVFVKTSATRFERREVQTGDQVGDRIIILHGLAPGEQIAVKGVMQLKGLSFGY